MVLAASNLCGAPLTRMGQDWQSNDKPVSSFVPPTYGIGCRYMKLFGKF
jgi:hypothetical protein